MAFVRAFSLALLLACCWTATGRAQEVVVPVDPYPPWKFTDRRNEVAGIDIQLMQALLERVGLRPRYVRMPWKRCLAAMEDGEADLMNGVLWSRERAAYLYYLEPPYKNRTVKAFYVRKGGGVVLGRFEDLRGLVIGTTLGAHYFPRFDEDATLVKDVVKNDAINVRKLAAGHIDCFIATEETGDYLIRKEGVEALVAKAAFRHETPTRVYFAISRQSRLMLRASVLSEALRRLVESGEVDRIIGEFLRGL